MSLAGKRAEIAAVLSTVPDVIGHEYRPTVPNVGSAWPLLSRLERADGYAMTVTWRVNVLLPQDELGASDWIDTHIADLFDALEPAGFVDSADPVNLGTETARQFGLQLIIRSED